MRNQAIIRYFTIFLLLALAGCNNSTAPTAVTSPANSSPSGYLPAAAPPPPLVVPAETVLVVTLDQTVGTKTSVDGDPFSASVAEPVMVDGREAIPRGARAAGHVSTSDKAGHIKGGARLALNLDSITVNGAASQIHTTPVVEEGKGRGKRTAVGAGGGAVAGAIIGAIAGGGKGAAIGAGAGAGAGTAGAAYTGNRDISIPAETRLRFRLTQSLPVPAR